MGCAFRIVWRHMAPQLITMKNALTMTAEVITILLILALGVLLLAL
jgi:hypothetical protein